MCQKQIVKCRILILFLLSTILLSFFCLFKNIEFSTKANAFETIEYTGEIPTLKFNTLMAFPERALHEKNHNNIEFDKSKITPFEFREILNELYKNNFVLIKISDVINLSNDLPSHKKLFLPPDKKPIILTFDNVTYLSNYQNLGEIDKIIIDRNNNIATYTTKKSIQERVQYDNEFVVILEDFIYNHPDFSFNSARGIMFFTGEHGVLGYSTNPKNSSTPHEKKRVLEVLGKLKSLGWEFGSNNYKYEIESNISDIEFAKQLSEFNKDIQPLIDNSKLFAYPFGFHNTNDKSKEQLLIENGYRVFFLNDIESKITIENNIAKVYRIAVNGESLRNNTGILSEFFDCKKVYDTNSRSIQIENTD